MFLIQKFVLFKLQHPKFFAIFFLPKNLSLPVHSILAACLISTTEFDPNSLLTQLARLFVFHLGSIQTPSDSDCQPPLHIAVPLYPSVTPSTWEPKATTHAPFFYGRCPFLSSP
jgi:hypothetical protein